MIDDILTHESTGFLTMAVVFWGSSIVLIVRAKRKARRERV